MDAIVARLRIADRIAFFERNQARIGAFFAGAIGTLMVGLLFSVIYSGQGIWTAPELGPQVYTNF